MKKNILVIVESPNKCKKIQSILGPGYVVKATVGHFCDLAKGGKNGIGIDIDNNFKCKYVLDPNKKNVLTELIDESENCKEILLATDPDREGEAIANHIKNYLSSSGKKMKRISFREITKDAINKALKQARDIDTNLVNSQESRRILDRIVGFMASPYVMKVFGDKLSAGRTQSAALKLIVDREKEIKSFTPDEYWNVYATLSLNNIDSFIVKYNGNKIKNKTDADTLKNKLLNEKFIVTRVTSKPKKEYPQPPLTTSKIQQICSKKLSISADETMTICQNLFENGMITYHRTDSVKTSEEAMKMLKEYIKNNYKLPSKENIYEDKDTAAAAHECIRPTDLKTTVKNGQFLSQKEKDVYQIIFDSFVASQMEPAIYDTLEVDIISDKSKEPFRVTGKALTYKGYLEIIGSNSNTKIDIPPLKAKDICTLFGKDPIRCEQKFTQPPSRYNEATLVAELEDKRIGRSSTYANITTKIANRHYVEKKGNTYYPTELGIKVVNKLKENFDFVDINYSALMEEKLDNIEEGKLKQIDMLTDFYKNFKKQLDKAYIDNGGVLCDKCSSPMVERFSTKTNKKFLGCSKWPKCNNIKNI